MKRRLILTILILLLAACQTPAAQAPVNTSIPPTPRVLDQPAEQVAPSPTAPPARLQPEEPTAAVDRGPNELQREVGKAFGGEKLVQWQPRPYQAETDQLPLDLAQVANPGVIANFTPEQRSALSQNGFTVLPTQEKQFSHIRDSVSKLNGQPYFLTTDSAYHALHITFDEVLKILERDHFRLQAAVILEVMLRQVQSFPAKGTALETDTRLAEAYLAVALRLFDPTAGVPADVAALVEQQIEQINTAAGREQSVLIPNFEDDYGAYQPIGHYVGDSALEAYFRGMTWLGRVAFQFKDAENPNFQPSRAPLILTLALRQDPGTAETWRGLNEMLDFLIGPSDDPGSAELSTLMDQIYGKEVSFADLTDETRWQQFLQQVDNLPAPQINSTFVDTTAALQASRDWRLLGQRFTFDALIFQNLIFDRVGTRDQQRKLPSGLDVMAVFGSPAAEAALQDAGEFDYENYDRQLALLQSAAHQQTEDQWLARFYAGWLYSFIPQVHEKDQSFPPFMRTESWNYKELNSALGSWAELKHDTALYAKMPEFMGGGGPPSSVPPPSYVEPNPEVFFRLAYIASELSLGLMKRIPLELYSNDMNYSYWLNGLAVQYRQLGEIAVKELAQAALTQEDFDIIQQCLGPVECMPDAFTEIPPVPVVAAVSGADNEILEVGVGYIDRIFVAVPINGQLQIAQGGVFSYYEFTQPRTDRLTDNQWREKVDAGTPTRPVWTDKFLLPGGGMNNLLAFRAGDWYKITAEGGKPPLNVRANPSKSASVLNRLEQGAYIQLVEGPVLVDGANWWKIRQDFSEAQGWVMENPAWFERAYGQ
jgi:hypothetical protein